jgi:hypothetical protein
MMATKTISGVEGGCDCGQVRYRLTAEPIMINCCHCRACQRQSGSAFGINVLIEAENVELLGEAPIATEVASGSGHGQAIMRCPHCGTAVWGVYHAAGDGAHFVRAGTLDDPDQAVPRAHIWTESKVPWVVIPEGVPRFEQFYGGRDLMATFGEENAARWRKALEG